MQFKAKDKKNIYFISGGGTGGHIYPAVTIAEGLLDESDTSKVFFIGNPDNLEHEIISKNEKIHFLPVKIKGMPRRFGLTFLKWFWDLEIATLKAVFYMLKYKPDAVFTTGGYVSAPAVFASILLRKPFIIHDCDAQPGLVSRLVAPFANMVSVAFEKSKEKLKSNKIVCNGNPIRKSFSELSKKEAREKLNLEDKFTIISMGGSQGAKVINDAVLGIIKYLVEDKDIQVIMQSGKKNYLDVMGALNGYEHKNFIVQPYFDDMSCVLKASDVAIARAGSLSLSEINICGLPSVLVPYPFAAADHQRKNAIEMQKNGAALYLEDADCNFQNLKNILDELIADKHNLQKMSEASFSLAKQDAVEKIIVELKSLIK